MDDTVPSVMMPRLAGPELAEPTLSPVGSHDAQAGGGGTPNDAADNSLWPQIVPAPNSPEGLTPLVEILDSVEVAESAVEVSSVVRWDGAPTKEMLRDLELSSRTVGFDYSTAVSVLTMVGDGMTVTEACEVVGIRRSVINAWRRLIPMFDDLMDEAVQQLGQAYVDKAAAAAATDPGVSGALLKVAGAYDRRIAKGDAAGGSQVAIVVNVNR